MAERKSTPKTVEIFERDGLRQFTEELKKIVAEELARGKFTAPALPFRHWSNG